MLKKFYVLGIVALSCSLFGVKQPPQAHIIVHDGAHVEWGRYTSFFETTDIVMMGKASFSLKESPPRPLRLVYPSKLATQHAIATRLEKLEETARRLNDEVKTLQMFPVQAGGANSENVDNIERELHMLTQSVVQQEKKLTSLLEGHFDIPLGQLSHPELAKVGAKLVLIEERFSDLKNEVAFALGNATMQSGEGQGDGLGVFAPFVRRALTKSEGRLRKDMGPMTRSIVLSHTTMIEVDSDVTIEGRGESITFAHTNEPQLVVKEGATLTLQNVTLKNIGSKSFFLEKGARLALGQGVRLELHDDISFVNGTITLSGVETIATICGVGGVRHIRLTSADKRQHSTLDLSYNTLALSNVVMHDAHLITAKKSATRDATLTGALALCSNATAELGGDLRVGVVAYGIDNHLVCLHSGYTLYGPVLFAPFGENDLSFQVMTNGHQRATATLASGALEVSSTTGTARFICVNDQLQLRLDAKDALCVGASGTIDASALEVRKNSIIQIDPSAHYTARTRLSSDQPDSIVMGVRTTPLMRTILHDALYDRYGKPAGEIWHTATSRESVIYYHALRMRNARGLVALMGRDARATDFGVDTSEQLELILIDGGTVEQSSKTVLKKDDVIRVRGKNNKLILTHDFTCYGSIVCEEGAQLTIEVQGGANFRFETMREHACIVNRDASLTFTGGGTMSVSRTLYVDMGDERTKPSRFSIADGMLCCVVSGAKLLFSGCGDVRLEQGARMDIGIAALVAGCMAYEDYLSFAIDTSAVLAVGDCMAHPSDARGRFSCGMGSFMLSCSRNGAIDIADNGALELNARQAQPASGKCRGVSFSTGGRCHVHPHGRVFMNDNLRSGMQQSPIVWEESGGGLYGEGCIGLAGQPFLGKSQVQSNGKQSRVMRGDARALVMQFVNLGKALSNTIYFVNSEGRKTVITSYGVVVTIGDDEDILHDDPGTGIISGKNQQGSFIIKPNGQRIG